MSCEAPHTRDLRVQSISVMQLLDVNLLSLCTEDVATLLYYLGLARNSLCYKLPDLGRLKAFGRMNTSAEPPAAADVSPALSDGEAQSHSSSLWSCKVVTILPRETLKALLKRSSHTLSSPEADSHDAKIPTAPAP